MARRKFEDGFKERAVAYCHEHPEKTMKACAADLDIGYSTLRRWMTQAEEPAQNTAAETSVIEKDSNADLLAADDVKPEAEAAESSDVEADGAVNEVNVDLPEPAAEEPGAEAPQLLDEDTETLEEPASVVEEKTLEAAPTEKDELDDDYLFSSIGLGSSSGANTKPHDEDYDLRCKSHPSAYKNIQHMAGDRIVSVSAQIGNIIEDIAGGMSNVGERLGLYKKRHDLKKERKLLKKEKQKRMKH